MLYNLPMYGCFPNVITKKPNRGIDKLIEKKRNKKIKIDKAVICGQVASMIIKNFEGKKVAIVSTSNSEKVKELYDRIKETIGGRITAILKQDFISTPEAIGELDNVDAIIVAEVRDDSIVADIDRMGEIIYISGYEVDGYIAL